jgi:prevent-host-death family protein
MIRVTMIAVEEGAALGALLDRVERGEAIVVTRRGKPIARIVPVRSGLDRRKARRVAENIIRASRGVTLGGLKVKDLISEGRS